MNKIKIKKTKNLFPCLLFGFTNKQFKHIFKYVLKHQLSYKNNYKNRLLYIKTISYYYRINTHKIMRSLKKFNNNIFTLITFFESRLDTTLFRACFCKSIKEARLIIKHKKILVNNIIVSKISLKMYKNDVITYTAKNTSHNKLYKSLFNIINFNNLLCIKHNKIIVLKNICFKHSFILLNNLINVCFI